jgi:hypothetical protein
VVIPSAALVLCLLVCLIVVLVVIIKRKGTQSDDWEINYDELEIGEQLGAGGYVAAVAYREKCTLVLIADPIWVSLDDGPVQIW